MKKLIVLILLCVAGWQLYKHQTVPVITNADLAVLSQSIKSTSHSDETFRSITYESIYECDGRQHCSQMGSCEEATFFIENCPNTKMDGNHDGVPCERQHCN